MGRPRKSPEQKTAQARDAAFRRWHPGVEPPAAFVNQPVMDADESIDLPGHCSYDRVVCRPVTYQDAVQREKAIAEELANEERKEQAEIRRGKLYTRDQVAERERTRDEVILGRLSGLSDFVASLVPIDQREAARAKANAWIAETREAVASKIRELKNK